ncbi:hypothetical protein ACOSQ4_031451 [Xanthoceras sorbifolium]
MSHFVSYDTLSPIFRSFVANLSHVQVPSNIHDALKRPEWRLVIQVEVLALEKNGTCEIADLPQGKDVVGCKWIFTVKHKVDGRAERFKARVVAKGFTQSYINYLEIFAPSSEAEHHSSFTFLGS